MLVLKFLQSLTLFRAIAAAMTLSSMAATLIAVILGRPVLEQYTQSLLRSNRSAIDAFFTDSIQQEILNGEQPEIYLKCQVLLASESLIRTIIIKDSTGEYYCNLTKPSDGYDLSWVESKVDFGDPDKTTAATISIGFSTSTEHKFSVTMIYSVTFGVLSLFFIQLLLLIPLTKKLLQPLALLCRSVEQEDPETIELPEIKKGEIVVQEVRTIFLSLQIFLRRFEDYKKKLIASTRFEAVAGTVQIISHDLKVPVAIFERITKMSSQQFDSERPNLVASLRQLYTMIDALKRAEFDELIRKRISNFDLHQIIMPCQAVAEKHGIKFVTPAKSLIEAIDIDETKLVRALSNLIINACEAAATTVELSYEKRGSNLLFIVEDDGSGVPDHMVQKLFQRGATAGKADGTGIGLNYIQRVAYGHGGEVKYIRSQNLTKFILSIPVENSSTESCHESADLAPGEVANISSKDQKKVLLFLSQSNSRLEAVQKVLSDECCDFAKVEDYHLFESNQYLFIFSDEIVTGLDANLSVETIFYDADDNTEQIIVMAKRMISNYASKVKD